MKKDLDYGGIEKDLEKAVRREWELEDGKTVVINFPHDSNKDFFVRVDYRCMDKDTDVCDNCKLRFRCYSSQYLVLDAKELRFELGSLKETISETVEAYIKSFKQKNDTHKE